MEAKIYEIRIENLVNGSVTFRHPHEFQVPHVLSEIMKDCIMSNLRITIRYSKRASENYARNSKPQPTTADLGF